MNDARKRRMDRIAQQKCRGSKQSYKTEVEDLLVLLLWEAGDVSEGKVCQVMGWNRIEARDKRIAAKEKAVSFLEAMGDPIRDAAVKKYEELLEQRKTIDREIEAHARAHEHNESPQPGAGGGE